MSGKCFVDTNVLIYAHDPRSGAKQAKAIGLLQELWDSRIGVLSTQVLQEFCINARRRASRPLSPRETNGILQDLLRWEIFVNTAASVVRALELEERYGISFWDALIVQAAQGSGTTTLYTEDLADGQMYGTVRAVNPFRN